MVGGNTTGSPEMLNLAAGNGHDPQRRSLLSSRIITVKGTIRMVLRLQNQFFQNQSNKIIHV